MPCCPTGLSPHAGIGGGGRARVTFQPALHCGNDIGLLSEEIDGAAGAQLGNVPQAFSHIGLVNTAWAIFHAERDVSVQPRAVVVCRATVTEHGPDPQRDAAARLRPQGGYDELAMTFGLVRGSV